MSNPSPKILWPIDYSSMTSITHWCNWLLIDDPSITHHLLYCAEKTLFLLSCTIFFSFVVLLSVLDAFFLVSGDPEDPALQEKGNELLHQLQIGGRNFCICRKWPLRPCKKTASIARSYWRICKTEQPWRGNRQGMVQQQTAKRYWRTFWTLISMYYLSWKE